MGLTEKVLILGVLVLLSAFFSGVETAFTSISNIRLQHLVEKGQRGFRRVRDLKESYERLLITILIGNNLVNIAASAFATAIAIDLYQDKGVAIAIGIMTLVILVFGEIIPKSVAMSKNEWIAVKAAPIIRFLQIILYPVIIIFDSLTRLIARPIDSDEESPIITEAEIKSVVNLGEEVGEVEEDERIMIHNIFRFNDLQANEIMLDRTRVFALDGARTIREVAPEVVAQGYSRIPVFEDNADNIIGILYAKDILQSILQSGDDKAVKALVRPAMFIPETMLIDDLLREFQKEKVHLAVVVDEHGGVSGLITIEDLLEEIVGDIYDETDQEEIMIRKVDKHRSVVKGETEIEEVNRVLDLGLNEREDYETISGFILAELRRIPEIGVEIKLGEVLIKVTKADPQRIIEVEITNPKAIDQMVASTDHP
jgi:CBS domain containing-hemolysin-like protein